VLRGVNMTGVVGIPISNVGAIRCIPDFLCDLVDNVSLGRVFNSLQKLDCRDSRHCSKGFWELLLSLKRDGFPLMLKLRSSGGGLVA